MLLRYYLKFTYRRDVHAYNRQFVSIKWEEKLSVKKKKKEYVYSTKYRHDFLNENKNKTLQCKNTAVECFKSPFYEGENFNWDSVIYSVIDNGFSYT